jgi:hypothetical protein
MICITNHGARRYDPERSRIRVCCDHCDPLDAATRVAFHKINGLDLEADKVARARRWSRPEIMRYVSSARDLAVIPIRRADLAGRNCSRNSVAAQTAVWRGIAESGHAHSSAFDRKLSSFRVSGPRCVIGWNVKPVSHHSEIEITVLVDWHVQMGDLPS